MICHVCTNEIHDSKFLVLPLRNSKVKMICFECCVMLLNEYLSKIEDDDG